MLIPTLYLFLKGAHAVAPVLGILRWAPVGSPVRRRFYKTSVLFLITCLSLGLLGAHLDWTYLIGTWAAHVHPFLLLSYIFFILGSYHLATQSYGLLAFYRYNKLCLPRHQRWDWWFCLVVYMVLIPGIMYFQVQRLDSLARYIPAPPNPQIWTMSLQAIGIGSALLLSLCNWFSSERSFPRVLVYWQIGVLPWLLNLAFPLYYWGFVILHHYLSEIGAITYLYKKREKRTCLPAVGLLLVLGLVWFHVEKLNPLLPSLQGLQIITQTPAYMMEHRWTLSFAGVLLGVGFAMNFIHYTADRLVFGRLDRS